MSRKQLKLNLNKGNWGGRRSGSGRKRLHSKGVAHRVREQVSGRTPLHLNFKYRTHIRNKDCLRLLKKASINRRSHGLRIIHFSLQSHHIHLIAEAENNHILTKGMRSLLVTFAKGLNQGRVQLERYHLHVLKSLRETKNAIHYVLFNEQKHRKLKKAYINQYSSLGVVDDLGRLAKSSKMLVIKKGVTKLDYLARAESWILKQAYS